MPHRILRIDLTIYLVSFIPYLATYIADMVPLLDAIFKLVAIVGALYTALNQGKIFYNKKAKKNEKNIPEDRDSIEKE